MTQWSDELASRPTTPYPTSSANLAPEQILGMATTLPPLPTTTESPNIESTGQQAVTLAARAAKENERWMPLADAVQDAVDSANTGSDATAILQQCTIATS
jgi:hypothetical protein